MLSDTQKTYAQAIREARTQAGLSQGKLSELCGGSPSRVTINRIENHQSPCSAETFESIVSALGLRLVVLDGQGNELAEIGPGPVKAQKRHRGKGRKAS